MSERKRKSTMVELVEEIMKLTPPKGMEKFQEYFVAEAKAGEYHDYKNQKYVCGKVAAVEQCRRLGYSDLAKRIIAGEFDEEADESDKANMKAECMAAGMSAEQCSKILGI